MDGIELRPACREDADEIVSLARQLEDGWELDVGRAAAAFLASVGDPHYFPTVAEAGGRIVGFLDLWLYPDLFHQGLQAVLQNLVVEEGSRGQGVGKMLMDRAIQMCEEKGVVEVHVTTMRKNMKAQGFYSRFGFGQPYGEVAFLQRPMSKEP